MSEPNILALTFNHVALPSQLPGKHDGNTEVEKVNKELAERLLQSVDVLRSFCHKSSIEALDSIEKSWRKCMLINGNGFVNRDAALGAFKEIEPGDALILYIAQQNACLYLRRPWYVPPDLTPRSLHIRLPHAHLCRYPFPSSVATAPQDGIQHHDKGLVG
jgi:hypothetical protein